MPVRCWVHLGGEGTRQESWASARPRWARSRVGEKCGWVWSVRGAARACLDSYAAEASRPQIVSCLGDRREGPRLPPFPSSLGSRTLLPLECDGRMNKKCVWVTVRAGASEDRLRGKAGYRAALGGAGRRRAPRQRAQSWAGHRRRWARRLVRGTTLCPRGPIGDGALYCPASPVPAGMCRRTSAGRRALVRRLEA